ncbi:hypothetical protein [Paenibacillus glucanolyticus]|uniref:hypothetical protein n=1 Tax=Paenibacillus glucanolyticus TaxID=59843 RepID=UPI00096CFD8D|nr:hypothetical protein [Paenibacillus glucanolyticus]OMF76691.1 hypothetical protein BK142_14310 [Paenibacillus glucanolyticus]
MSKLTREQFGVALGDSILIRGTVKSAKLDKPVDGAALDKVNQRRLNKGMKKTKPFRRITIKNPSIVEGQGSPLAKFYEQNIYRNKLTFESKSLFPPAYKHMQNGEAVIINDPQKNPATGQEIMIRISTFQSKGFPYLGSGIDAIIFPEGPIKFYEVSRAEEHLPGFGISIDLPIDTPLVNTRGFAAAPIIAPEKVGIDISRSPFSGVINSNIIRKTLPGQTTDTTRDDASELPAAADASMKKIHDDKEEAKAGTNPIDIDSPFGPSRITKFTEKTDLNSTKPLSRFT